MSSNTNIVDYQRKIKKILDLNNQLIEAKMRENRDKERIKHIKEQIKLTIDRILNR